MLNTLLILALWLATMTALYLLFTRRSHARLVRERVFLAKEEDHGDTNSVNEEPFLSAWLTRAGFRATGSSSAFVLATVMCLVLGATLALFLHYIGAFDLLVERAAEISEGMGSMAKTGVQLVPWAIFGYISIAPWLFVRSRRRQRVLSIDNGLPMVLELLATMSEAGLGFDASFSKILDNEKTDSPLVEEFQLFQFETLAGVPRVRCFRRLTRRCGVSAMTIFCSAMIQAEQVGAGFSTVLRSQATDLRSRRRERAMMKAQALPVKLVFPLVICFLPGIFVVTLAPAFMQFFEMAEGVIRGG